MSNALEAFLEYIVIVKALSPLTCKAYELDLKQFENFLQRDIITATTKDVIDFLSTLDKKSTLNRKLAAINSFFDFCVKSKFIKEKPSLKAAKIPQSLPKFMEYEEFKNRLKLIDRSTWIGKRDFSFLMFLYASGARVSEALNVKRGDIEGIWLKIREAKGEKERLIPLPPSLIKHIEDYLNQAPIYSDYLWINYKGKKLSRIYAFKISKKYLGVSDSCWQERVPEPAGPGPDTPQPLGGGTPGGLRGHHVVQWEVGVRQDPVHRFHNNTSVHGT